MICSPFELRRTNERNKGSALSEPTSERGIMDFDEQNSGNLEGHGPAGSPEEAGKGEFTREDPRGAPVPDLMRKALELGFTGLFTTEQAIRRALGESLPQEWVDFVSDQSERTRADFTNALVSEFGRSLDNLDLAETLDQFLSGRTIELTTRIRVLPRADTDSDSKETKA